MDLLTGLGDIRLWTLTVFLKIVCDFVIGETSAKT
jgi:hypothetical protein